MKLLDQSQYVLTGAVNTLKPNKTVKGDFRVFLQELASILK